MLELLKIRKDINWLIDKVKCLVRNKDLASPLSATEWSTNHEVSTGNPYLKDSFVWLEGDIYKSLIDHNVYPPTNEDYWEKLGEGHLLLEEQSDWDATTGRPFIKNKPTNTSDFNNDGENGFHPFITLEDVSVPNLQEVTDEGNITTSTLILTPAEFTNAIEIEGDGDDGLIKILSNAGTGVNSRSNYGVAVLGVTETSIGVYAGANSIDGIALFASNGNTYGTAAMIIAINGTSIQVFNNSGIGAEINLGSTSKGIVINSGTSSEGNPIEINKNGVDKLTINQEGELSIVKIPDGDSTQYLMADGSTTSILGYTPLDKAGDTILGELILNGDPIGPLGAATKQYVDTIALGINFHAPVRVATTGNLEADYDNGIDGVGASLTGLVLSSGPLEIDSTILEQGNRVLVWQQTETFQNGIYEVTDAGNALDPFILTRTSDADNSPVGEIVSGDYVLSLEGYAYVGYGFICNTPGTIIIGTTGINFVQFNAAQAVTPGYGLREIVSNLIAINPDETQEKITLTTTGSSGAATLINNILNIPQYSGNGGSQNLQQVLDIGNFSTINLEILVEDVIGIKSTSTTNAGVYGESTDNSGIFGRSTNSDGVYATTTNGNALGLRVPSTGTPFLIKGTRGATVVYKVNHLGELTATKIIKEGGTSSQYLMADGSVTTGGPGGSQNLQQVLNIGNTTDTSIIMNIANTQGILINLSEYSVGVAVSTIIGEDMSYPLIFNNDQLAYFQVDNGGNLFSVGSLEAHSFVKTGGLATEYLMADGSTTTASPGGSATNLGYTPSPTNGIVTSDTGTDATVPLADATNAGLLKPAKFTVLENTTGSNSGDETTSTIKSKLGITTLSGANTGDQSVNTLTNVSISTLFDGDVLQYDGPTQLWENKSLLVGDADYGNDNNTYNSTLLEASFSNLNIDINNKISKGASGAYTTNTIRTVSAAEYAAIGTKDPNTLYFII